MLKFLSRATLRQMLTVPYVVLVLLAAMVIGWLSYTAGSDAVDTLAEKVLFETVSRIGQAVEKHVSGSEAVLETAFPKGEPPPASIATELEALRTRFWLATTVHLDVNNYAYYGNRNGQFLGLWRFSETEAELRLRTEPDSVRQLYRYTGMRGELKNPMPEARVFDPRERPWYKAGQAASAQTWTSIYIDFKTLQLVGTRARRVNNAAGEFEGVVATDLSLQRLNEFLKGLQLSANAIAFIVEPDGNLVATSRGPHLRKGVGEDNTRLNARDSTDPLIVAAYQMVLAQAGRADALGNAPANKPTTQVRSASFKGADGEVIQTGYAHLRDYAGLDWVVVVAVPRDDFMHKVTDNVRRTAWLALLVCVLSVLTGLAVLNLIASDLRRLAKAAGVMGEGGIAVFRGVERRDEIGALARFFNDMQTQLFTDPLTGIANREAMVRRIEDRIIRQRRRGDSRPFAVLFIDLNGFKKVNDQLGHDVGDAVLVEVAQRLAGAVREGDLAARYGGDEFVVLLENVNSAKDAQGARTKLERVLAEPMAALRGLTPDPAALPIGGAIGIAVCPQDGADLESLLKHADDDMYQRKQARVAEPRTS
jgi:diguanylate cyclase (GGDEF)-like protein